MTDTILIVDDESSMRQTYQGWLKDSGWNLRVFAVANDEQAIKISQTTAIDLAILDWNLECGLTGLDLLENLREDQPDLVAIMITGYAGTATPLKALRMGVRDYLDKNQELNRENFLKAVGHQLEKIRPARQQRAFAKSLFEFHSAIDRILPLVRSSSILNDPVPVSAAVKTLFRFLMKLTQANDGVLLIQHVSADGSGAFEAWSAEGERIDGGASEMVPFSHSLAATVISMQEACGMTRADYAHLGPIRLQTFEKDRDSLLLASASLGGGSHAVFELFDRIGAERFSDEDRQRLTTGSELGGELLRQTLNEKHTRSLLFDAIAAALEASRPHEDGTADEGGDTIGGPMMESIRRNLAEMPGSVLDSEASIRLSQAIRSLASRHGDPAVRHCQKLIDSLLELLDRAAGMDGG